MKKPPPADATENQQSSLQLCSHSGSLFWCSAPSGCAPVSLTSLPIGNIGQRLPLHKLIVHDLLQAKCWRAEVNKRLRRDVNINNLRMAKFFLVESVLKEQQNVRLGISVTMTFSSSLKVWRQLIFRTEENKKKILQVLDFYCLALLFCPLYKTTAPADAPRVCTPHK